MKNYTKTTIVIVTVYAAVLLALVLLLICGRASACTGDIATVDTEVYVRSMEGEVVGSLKKGDNVLVTGKSGGWNICEIGGTEYRVWHEYMTLKKGVSLDEVKLISKPRKSKDLKNGIKGKTKHSITGSVFDGVNFW